MPFNGSGGTTQPAGSIYPATANTLIESAKANTSIADLYTMLAGVICKDGQTTITANIPLSGYKLTGVGAATARTDAATLASIQDGTGVYVATVGGTADVITLTPSPVITAYGAGQTFRFIASGVNTTNVTVNVSALGAKAITKNGATALAAGDIPSGSMVQISYDGTRFILGAVAAIGSSVLTTIGDGIIATTAGAAARIAAKADVAAHATTADPWVAREIVLTGGAVTFTAIANAPYVGAVAWVKQNAAHVWTNGATFNVQGNANYTATADDWVRIYATTVSTFEVTVFKADGTAVAVASVAENVQQTVKTDTYTSASTSATDITGMSVSITPSSATSKVLVMFSINMAVSGSNMGAIKLLRGSTEIGSGATAGTRPTASTGIIRTSESGSQTTVNFTFLDSPASASATTYKLQHVIQGGTIYVNRTEVDTDGVYPRYASTITAMEIKQ